MADLLANDHVLMDDIVGLLDLDAPMTPKLSTIGDVHSFFIPITSNASPSSASGDDTTKTSKRSVKREQEKLRQRRYRQRLKDSQDELQAQVDALTKKLEALEQVGALTKKKKTTDASDTQLSCSQWIKEASYQRNQRLQAEAHQRELLSAMNCQVEYIKSLRKMHHPRPTTTAYGGGAFLPPLYSMPSVLYTTYLQQLEGCYARVDTVMDACGLASLPETTLNSVHRRKTDGGVAYFQQVNKVFLPYSFQQTCDVLWKVVHNQDEPAFGGFEVAPDSDVFIKSRVLKTVNVGSLAQRYVSRRYLEENRLVLVWNLSSEGEDGFHGLHADETGWLCVEPSPGGVVLSVCVQQVPMQLSSPYSPEPATKPFYHLLSESLEADKEEMTACMGRMLLEELLTGIDC